jgi:putative ABC transport system permease protein
MQTSLIIQGIAWSLATGRIDGLFPAMRAARAPINEALRTL